MPPLLVIFEAILRLRNWYNDIVTVKNYEQTFTIVASVPLAWMFLFYTRIPDSFIIWVGMNTFFLWPILKKDSSLK